MEDFSDGTNRTIIVLGFFFLYLYLKYTQTQLRLAKNLGTIQCNPLEMMVGGIFNEAEASKTFQNCLEYSSSKTLSKTQKEAKKKYDTEIEEILTNLKKNDASNAQERAELMKLLNQKKNDVGDLVQQQARMNDSLTNATPYIKDIVDRISTIFDSFQSSFKKYNDKLAGTS